MYNFWYFKKFESFLVFPIFKFIYPLRHMMCFKRMTTILNHVIAIQNLKVGTLVASLHHPQYRHRQYLLQIKWYFLKR